MDSTKRPVKFSLLSLKDSDAGRYEMKVKATLKNWKDVKSVIIPFVVEVKPCTPLTLLP